ncbi:hypothetical protein DRJ48_05220 [Candidatus Woesearchaeota archaeon]|nr:MAG: hypothetical protein DRJ48_05220 [Candidatus Woesearchaeota archaeon]
MLAQKFIRHESLKHAFVKFLLIVALVLIYGVITVIKYGLRDGIFVSLLTWSFFVFCTPIADAGFLLDFPLRIITGIRMIYSEIVVWVIALLINISAFATNPSIYEKTLILSLFKHIITQPFPFWGIIVLSGAGTFLSVYFGDEVVDIVSNHRKRRPKYERHASKYRLIVFAFIIALIIVLYDFLLNKLGIKLPLV